MIPRTKVLYHSYPDSPCPDGFAAAWAVWSALGSNVAYIPVVHDEPPPNINPGDTVFIVDFSYPREVLLDIASKAKIVALLDHHENACREIMDLPFVIFDNSKSGAMLAWEHFHPGYEPPALIRYAQDRDLWKHELPHTREVYAAMQVQVKDFEVYDALVRLGDEQFVAKLSHIGTALLESRDREVAAIAATAQPQNVAGYDVLVVPNCDRYHSDVGNYLCAHNPEIEFAATWDIKDGIKYWSARSIGDFDVSAIARQFGGNGHKNAAGWREKIADSPQAAEDSATTPFKTGETDSGY